MYSSAVVRARAPHFYPEDRFYFDTDAVFQILIEHDFGFVHQVLTFTRYQPASITYNERHFLSRNIDRVLSLHQYGQFYLTPEEFNRAMSNAWRAYYGNSAVSGSWIASAKASPSSGSTIKSG